MPLPFHVTNLEFEVLRKHLRIPICKCGQLPAQLDLCMCGCMHMLNGNAYERERNTVGEDNEEGAKVIEGEKKTTRGAKAMQRNGLCAVYVFKHALSLRLCAFH